MIQVSYLYRVHCHVVKRQAVLLIIVPHAVKRRGFGLFLTL